MFNSPPANLEAALRAAFLPRPAVTQPPLPGPADDVQPHGHRITNRPERLSEASSAVESASSTTRAS